MKALHNVGLYQPVIIIGAARSGTNMLRDVLTQLPGLGTWPCDEINYIWRHGNVMASTDELGPEHATPAVCDFIRQKFSRQAHKQALTHLVEKTCANSLRVGFVNQVLPQAQFIHIMRDGRDVVASAQKRWKASLELPYIIRKARYVPLTDLPYYASRYVASRFYRMLSHERRLSTWGPRFSGIDQMLKQYSLAEVCALQWQQSVTRAAGALEAVDPSRVFHLQYEAFVTEPGQELQRLGDFLGLQLSTEVANAVVRDVSASSIGHWKSEFDSSTVEQIEALVQETLEQYNYPLVSAQARANKS